MSLGEELAAHLPFLRRFARALLGSQKLADGVITYVVRSIAENPELAYEFEDVRVALYRLFHDTIADAPPGLWEELAERQLIDEEFGVNERIGRLRLKRISASNREALLLTSLEGFSSEDAAIITRSEPDLVDERVAEALLEIERQTKAKILIIEDEPIVAMDLMTIVQDLGHEIAGIAVTKDEALQMDNEEVGLILADVQLADNSSGIEAVEQLLARRRRPLIYITAFPERVLRQRRTEPTFLISKPFERSTVKAAIAQALFFDSAMLPEDDSVAAHPPLLEAQQIVAKSGPVNAEVRAGQLRIVDIEPAETPTDFGSIEAARKLHLKTAKQLLPAVCGSNVAPRLHHRLDAIRRALVRPLTEEKTVQLGIQAQGFEIMLSGVAHILEEELLADLSVFASDLLDLARQFPKYRAFVDEAATLNRLSKDESNALKELVQTFAVQPDLLVEPELKLAIVDVREVADQRNDAISDLALLRTAGNLVRAVARLVNKHASAIAKKTGETFDSLGGKFLGTSLVALLLGAPTVGVLILLQTALPAEFGFVAALIRLAKSLIG